MVDCIKGHRCMKKKIKVTITETKKKRLDEVSPTTELWQCKAILTVDVPLSDEEPGLEDYRNSIRVRCGVTVVDGIGASRKEGGRLISKLRIKFATDGPPEYELRRLKTLISQIKGVRSISFLAGTLTKAEIKWRE